MGGVSTFDPNSHIAVSRLVAPSCLIIRLHSNGGCTADTSGRTSRARRRATAGILATRNHRRDLRDSDLDQGGLPGARLWLPCRFSNPLYPPLLESTQSPCLDMAPSCHFSTKDLSRPSTPSGRVCDLSSLGCTSSTSVSDFWRRAASCPMALSVSLRDGEIDVASSRSCGVELPFCYTTYRWAIRTLSRSCGAELPLATFRWCLELPASSCLLRCPGVSSRSHSAVCLECGLELLASSCLV